MTIGTVLEFATTVVADIGITSMGATAAAKLVPETAKAAEKVCCWAGAVALEGVAATMANAYIHDYFEKVREAKKKFETLKAIKQEEKNKRSEEKAKEEEETEKLRKELEEAQAKLEELFEKEAKKAKKQTEKKSKE